MGTNPEPVTCDHDSEVIIVQGQSRKGLIDTGEGLRRFLSAKPDVRLADVAYTVNCPLANPCRYRLAIVADGVKKFVEKLDYALDQLGPCQCRQINDRRGMFFFAEPLGREGKLAILFPGEGAQYQNMLSALCVHFPVARASFDRADGAFAVNHRTPRLSQVLFPPAHLSTEAVEVADRTMWSMEYAVMAVYAADFALYNLTKRLEIVPDTMVGHSVGQDLALWVSGALPDYDEQGFLNHCLETRTSFASIDASMPRARLMAVGALEYGKIASLVAKRGGDLFIAMDNCPNQVVLCGSDKAIEDAFQYLTGQGALCSFLPFNRAYHTPWYQAACDYVAEKLKGIAVRKPRTELYHYGTARPCPDDPDEIRHITAAQWGQPVRFRETIKAMYKAGVRIFLEVGPRGNLVGFVEDILGRDRYIAVPLNVPSISGLKQLNRAIALLAAHGVGMRLDYLYEHRRVRRLEIFGEPETALHRLAGLGKKKKRTAGIKLSLALPSLKLTEKNLRGFMLDVQGSRSAPRQKKETMAQPDETFGPRATELTQKAPDTSQFAKSHTGADAMAGYFETMERFVDDQEKILAALFEGENGPVAMRASTKSDLTRLAWSAPVAHIPGSEGIFCCLCADNDSGVQTERLAGLVLAEKELEVWQRLQAGKSRKRQWLRGRTAAKDAVYLFLKNCCQAEVRHGDMVILPDRYGRPTVMGPGLDSLGCALCLSISHAGDISVAIVAEGSGQQQIGIDIERADRDHEGLEEGGFTEAELLLLQNVPAGQRKEWLLRCWCAKEAVAKAFGRGLSGSPFSVRLCDVDFETGRTGLKAGEKRPPADRAATVGKDKQVMAYTGRDGDLVFAVSALAAHITGRPVACRVGCGQRSV